MTNNITYLAEYTRDSTDRPVQPSGVIDPFVADDICPEGIATVADEAHAKTMSVLLKLIDGTL